MYDVSMQLGCSRERDNASRGLQEERKCVLAWRNGSGSQSFIEDDCKPRLASLGVGLNESVPHEKIGLLYASKDLECIFEVPIFRERSEGNEAACCIIVEDAGSDDHLGVDLEDGSHGGASVCEERKRG
ncbi:hypothetical protein AMTR_s00099p00157520 [Amborella trichopoda]|uniref:Uncharacterized protein n=1 Tax=Amborella trichopoda TaxID=13333 RepID=W1NYN7_AMBTC|nr:hypothetical protein AMTR_s00099p00157520 [Amborella trichopoda]